MPDILPLSAPQKNKFSVLTVVLILLLVVALGLGYYYYRLKSSEVPTEKATEESTTELVKSNYVLPTGSQTYKFNHGPEVKGPKIQSVTIDPLDPEQGTTQTFTLVIGSKSKLTEATVIVGTDHLSKNLNLQFTGGTLSSGTYQGSWTVSDTYDAKYSFRYVLKDTETFDNTMYLR